MIGLLRRIFQDRCNILRLEIGVAFENFIATGAGGEHVKHVGHAYPKISDAGSAAAYVRICADL